MLDARQWRRRLPTALLLMVVIASQKPCNADTLRDYGPQDPVINFPLWYRDNGNLALQLCTSTATHLGGQLCFPPPDVLPWPGSVGDEAFYSHLEHIFDFRDTGGLWLRYIAGLEAAYVGGAAVKGDEMVFARVRIVAHTPCDGTWTVTHPYGEETFTDIPAGVRSIFFTADIGVGNPQDWEGPLKGKVAPFIRWAGADYPLNVLNPDGITESFAGNPTIPHKYTGSPTGNNFVRIKGPPGCDIRGTGELPINDVSDDLGAVLGQIWTEKIPTRNTPLGAVFSSIVSGGAVIGNVIDVEAVSESANKLSVVGSGDFPTTPMTEVATNVPGSSLYHAQILYAGNLPNTLYVVNTKSTPNSFNEILLQDIIQITDVKYTPGAPSKLCVTATSSDAVNPKLDLEAQYPLITKTLGNTGCSSSSTGGSVRCGCVDITDPAAPPFTISVVSEKGGFATSHVLIDAINSGAPTSGGNTLTASGGTKDVAIGGPSTVVIQSNIPSGAVLLILSQPYKKFGTVVASTDPTATPRGAVVFTPTDDATVTDPVIFFYAVKDGDTLSNVAQYTFNLKNVALPPKTKRDAFATYRRTTPSFPLAVLDNDVPGSQGTVIDKNSIQVFTIASVTKGIPTKTTDGSGMVSYKPPTSGTFPLSDKFTYSVANTATTGGDRSVETPVYVQVFSSAETFTNAAARYRIQNVRWTITLTDVWSGSFNVGTENFQIVTTVTCSLTVQDGITLTTPVLIGSGTVDLSLHTVTIDVLGNTKVACINTARQCQIRCKSNWGYSQPITAAVQK